MIFVRCLSEIRYFESRKPIIPTGFRYCIKLHFRHFRFRFLSGWSCFNGLVRNLNLECAWRQSYHSIKRIINPAFLSQRDADIAWRGASSSGSNLVSCKGNQCTRGIWKVMHIHPYNFTQWSEKKDEGISVNIRIWGFRGYHFKCLHWCDNVINDAIILYTAWYWKTAFLVIGRLLN